MMGMGNRDEHGLWMQLLLGAVLTSTQVGCDESKDAAEAVKQTAPAPEAPPPPATPKRAPDFKIDEISPSVGFSRAVITDASGKPNPTGREALRNDLTAEKEFIEGKSIILRVDRKAKPAWVSIYLEELDRLAPSAITIATETRTEYPKQLPFVPESQLKAEAPCSLVGAITDDRGTAIWRISGGTARKRGRGLGGPDLTMTGDTIISMAKGCDSDLFVVSASEEIDEWGLIYDLGASGVALAEAGLKRAAFPSERPTLGHPLQLKK